MTGRVHVGAGLPAYDVAVGGLPRSAVRADGPAGSIAVVAGGGAWWDEARRVVGAGAIAVVVDEPREVPVDAARRLREELAVPVVVGRSGLRDVLVAASVARLRESSPRSLVVECASTAVDAARTVRDAVGWLRALAGGGLALTASARGRGGASALLAGPDGLVASLLLTLGPGAGGLLRAQALGETAVEVVLDERTGRAGVTVSDASGRLRTPSPFEQPERETLRRALRAAQGHDPATDLEGLGADAALASAILAG